MLEVGDSVKVISKAKYNSGREVEHIPIGTICKVIDVQIFNGEICYNIRPINIRIRDYWYSENELEKGHLEWVKED